jgi:hydroxymethylpyrimidine pyrophosphatase-like HAD family hydrolase
MLVLDLDGTLLTAERRLAPIDVRAARALQDAGVVVTIATGRLFGGTRWVAEALGVDGPVAVMNGCEVLDARDGAPLFGAYVSPDTTVAFRDVLAHHGLASFLFESHGIHYGLPHHHLSPYLGIWSDTLVPHDDVHATAPWGASSAVVAVSACGPAERVSAARDALQPLLGDAHVAIQFQTFHGDGFLELRRDEDKGVAIGRLAAHHGLSVEDVVAVGDWINDLPMLRAAGRSFAVAHAHPEAVEAADEQLAASRDGGVVAELAERVWGLRL